MKKLFKSLSNFPNMQEALTNAAGFCGKDKPLPPLLAVLPSSVELEPVMDGLCDELEDSGLVSFTGEKRWLNILIDCPEGGEFPSFSRMLESLRRTAGYRNNFSGVVRIDLTAWLDNIYDERMSALFAFIYDYSDEIFFIITVSDNDARRADALKKELNRWMYTITVDVRPFNINTLVSVVEDKLTESGHTLSDDARLLIRKSVEKLAEQEDFTGLREIESFATAIAISTVSHKKISAGHLSDFALDGQWMEQHSDSGKITIGFDGGNTNVK